jgi:uncharacterized membrane protein YhaH (DUF805 family)
LLYTSVLSRPQLYFFVAASTPLAFFSSLLPRILMCFHRLHDSPSPLEAYPFQLVTYSLYISLYLALHTLASSTYFFAPESPFLVPRVLHLAFLFTLLLASSLPLAFFLLLLLTFLFMLLYAQVPPLRYRLPNSPFRPSDTRDYDGLQNTGPEYHGPPLCRASKSKTV